MWKKDNQLFILNNKVLTQEPSQNPRIQVTPLKSGNILSVKKAEKLDAGLYSCQVSAIDSIEQVHKVVIINKQVQTSTTFTQRITTNNEESKETHSTEPENTTKSWIEEPKQQIKSEVNKMTTEFDLDTTSQDIEFEFTFNRIRKHHKFLNTRIDSSW